MYNINTKVKQMNEDYNTYLKRLILICFAILLIVTPVIFAWHIEIGWDIKPNTNFTNGFFVKDIVKVYHGQMYMLFILNFLAAGYILYGAMKGGKE